MGLRPEVIRARTNHEAFLTMVRASINKFTETTLEEVVNSWASTVGINDIVSYQSVLDTSILVVIHAIQFRLMSIGYEKNDLEFKESKINYFTFNKGVTMATKKADKKGFKLNKKPVGKTKKPASKKPGLNKPVTKKHEVKVKSGNAIARELLLEKKHTDEEIIQKIQKILPDREDKQCKVYISVNRSELNSGMRKGLRKNEKLERLVQVSGKVIPYSQAPRKSNVSNKKKRELKMLTKHTNIKPGVRKRKVLKSV